MIIYIAIVLIFCIILSYNSSIESFENNNLSIKIFIKGTNKILSISEIEIYDINDNLLKLTNPRQSTTDWNGYAYRAIDNYPSDNYHDYTVTQTEISNNPYFIADLPKNITADMIKTIILRNRSDVYTERLNNAHVTINVRDINKIILDLGDTGLWDSIYSKIWTKDSKQWLILDREIINVRLSGYIFDRDDYSIPTS